MGLGNAALAGLLALAALPILVHLAFRRRTRTIRFPSLRLLRTVDPHLARRRRLRELALLALRTAVLLLAVLAVLRPWSGASAAPSAGGDRVVLLDDSASTALGGESSAFAAEVAAARGVFEGMRAGDRGALHLVVAGPRAPKDGLTQDARALLRALDGLERSDGRGSLAAALRRAGEALSKGTSPDRRLVLVTDLDAGAFAEPDLAAAVRSLPAGTRLVAATVSRPAAARDVAVTKLSVAPGPCVVGRPLHVTVTVERRAGAVAAAAVRLTLSGGSTEVREAPLSSAGVAEVAFDATPTVAGPTSIEASVDPDDFPPNDRRHLVVTARAQVALALVDGDLEGPAAPALSGGALVALALDPPGDGSLTGILVRRRGPAEADVAEVRAADAIVLYDAPELPEALVQAIVARHREGAGLLVFAGKRSAAASRATPEAIDPFVPSRVYAPPGGGDPAPLTVVAPDDPFLLGLAAPGAPARLEGVAVQGVLSTAPRVDATTLLASAGHPVLLRGAGRPAPALLFAAPLDLASTPWALRPTFLAFLHGVVPRLARGGEAHATVVAGETGGGRVVTKAGAYDLERGDAAFAAVSDLREAEALRLDAATARDRLGGSATVVAVADLPGAFAAGGRSDWTGTLLVLAAAALLAETVLAYAARRRLSVATRARLVGSDERPGEAVA